MNTRPLLAFLSATAMAILPSCAPSEDISGDAAQGAMTHAEDEDQNVEIDIVCGRDNPEWELRRRRFARGASVTMNITLAEDHLRDGTPRARLFALKLDRNAFGVVAMQNGERYLGQPARKGSHVITGLPGETTTTTVTMTFPMGGELYGSCRRMDTGGLPGHCPVIGARRSSSICVECREAKEDVFFGPPAGRWYHCY